MIKIFSVFLCMGLLSSCGDLFPKKVIDKEVDAFATCELDTNSLSKVLREDIQSDLNCLRANLKFFIEIVKTDKLGYLSHARLVEYIDSNMIGVEQVTLDALAGIFDINNLLFGDERGYISKENVDNLVNLFKRFNLLMVENKIHHYFTVDESVTFYEHNRRKAIIYSTFKKLSELFENAVIPNANKIKVADVIAKFKNFENPEVVDYVSSMLWLKKAFLGGNEIEFSSKELMRMVSMMGNASKIIYDFVNLPDTRTSVTQDEEVLQILKEDLLSVYNSFYFKDSADIPILTFDQLKDMAEKFFPEFKHYFEYKSSILKLKEVFLGSNSEIFSSQEISSLIYDILYRNVTKGVFFYNAYAYNQQVLDSPEIIVNDFTNLRPLVSNSMEAQFVGLFNRIAKSGSNTEELALKGYKYLHGTSYIPLFDFDHKRNPRGMFEVAIYEYLAGKFFTHYGTEDFSAVGDFVMSLEQLENLMRDFGEFFVGEGYVFPGKEVSSAETITLMATLFHPTSNGDSRLEINEFVELVVTMTSSLRLATDMQSELRDQCGEANLTSIHPGCYRAGLVSFLEKSIENRKRKDFLPGLYAYLKELTPWKYDQYIRSAAKFSRTCTHFADGTEVPMVAGDFIVSWGGLLAIEQTMLTFDTDKSGVLEAREVDLAYRVYKSAIEALIPPGFMQRFSYQIFQYMVRYRRVPDVPDVSGISSFWKAVKEGSHLLQFIVRPNRYRRSFADRMTFAKVLEIIADNSPSVINNPFDCELLRNDETDEVLSSFTAATLSGEEIPSETDLPTEGEIAKDVELLLQASSQGEVQQIQQQQIQQQR